MPGNATRALAVTGRRHDLVAITITDPREMNWPGSGMVALEDAETGASLWVDTNSIEWREAFVHRVVQRQEIRDEALRRAKVDRIDIVVGQDYVLPLLRFFERRVQRLRR